MCYSPEGFVRRCGDNFAVVKRRLKNACSDKTAEVRHVTPEEGPNFIGDCPETFIIQKAASRETGTRGPKRDYVQRAENAPKEKAGSRLHTKARSSVSRCAERLHSLMPLRAPLPYAA